MSVAHEHAPPNTNEHRTWYVELTWPLLKEAQSQIGTSWSACWDVLLHAGAGITPR
jgi:hypothetical protein